MQLDGIFMLLHCNFTEIPELWPASEKPNCQLKERKDKVGFCGSLATAEQGGQGLVRQGSSSVGSREPSSVGIPSNGKLERNRNSV